jgi:cyclopropane fatty-acyl-phospholipid synthase-like methyltransferase
VRGSSPESAAGRVARSKAAYPLTARYDPAWIRANALGENALCQVEILSRRLPFRSGMRVLDLACGNATSSIFLAREFGVEVWAVDGQVSPNDNRTRAIEFGCERSVFPLRVEAHALPFAAGFFDAIIAIDSYLYFGTDDRYLGYLAGFVKAGGYIGVVDIGFTREVENVADVPEYLRRQYPTHWSFVHCAEWWRTHWTKTGLVDVICAEYLAESEELLHDYIQERPPAEHDNSIMWAVPRDHDGLIALMCLVGRKR